MVFTVSVLEMCGTKTIDIRSLNRSEKARSDTVLICTKRIVLTGQIEYHN